MVCGGTSGQKVEVDLPRLFFKQIEIIGSTMGSYEEFDDVVRLVEQGLPVAVDEVFPSADYPRRSRAPRGRGGSSARSCSATDWSGEARPGPGR